MFYTSLLLGVFGSGFQCRLLSARSAKGMFWLRNDIQKRVLPNGLFFSPTFPVINLTIFNFSRHIMHYLFFIASNRSWLLRDFLIFAIENLSVYTWFLILQAFSSLDLFSTLRVARRGFQLSFFHVLDLANFVSTTPKFCLCVEFRCFGMMPHTHCGSLSTV